MNQDVANGDVRAGDFVMIAHWCRDKAYINTILRPGVSLQVHGAEPLGRLSKPNGAFLGDVLEIVSVEYPWAITRVFSCGTFVGVVNLNLTEVELKRPAAAFIAAATGRPELGGGAARADGAVAPGVPA